MDTETQETEAVAPTYTLTEKEQEQRTHAYKKLSEMRELKTRAMPHFSGPNGRRSFLQYIDEGERILNGYTPSREEQGKEAWQSNFMDNVSRAKLRAVAASVGLRVPDISVKASNAKGLLSAKRAEVMKRTTQASFLQGNPKLNAFLETWSMLAAGGVIEYEGYLSGGCKREVVDSFNLETGEVKTRTEYVKVDGRPISIIIRPEDFYWEDWYKRDIQDQSGLAWVQRYNTAELETEFSRYANYKHIKSKREVAGNADLQTTTFYNAWKEHVSDDDYAVFRRYSKADNRYEIWINGIPMLIAPLLWSEKGLPVYPFTKTISEPFANPDFFWGMHFPHLFEGYSETKTTSVNNIIDKLYRSFKKPMLVGLGNKDLLDVEDEMVDDDDKFYVPDVDQVKPFPFEGVQQSDLAMLQMIDRYIDLQSIDPAQQGIADDNTTARATVLADERAQELKGILFMFLEDLWLQKYRARSRTVLTHWLKDIATRTSFKDQIITVDDVLFSDGKRGTLAIHIAPTAEKLLTIQEIDAREAAMEEQGIPYQLISVTKDYLDEWDYETQIIAESLYNQTRLKKRAKFEDKMATMVSIFPEYVASNKEKLFNEFIEIDGESPADYNPPAAPPAPEEGGGGLGLLSAEEPNPTPV